MKKECYNCGNMDIENAKKVINLISDEAKRIVYGKVFIEVTVAAGRATNIQAETKRSVNLNSDRSTE